MKLRALEWLLILEGSQQQMVHLDACCVGLNHFAFSPKGFAVVDFVLLTCPKGFSGLSVLHQRLARVCHRNIVPKHILRK